MGRNKNQYAPWLKLKVETKSRLIQEIRINEAKEKREITYDEFINRLLDLQQQKVEVLSS